MQEYTKVLITILLVCVGVMSCTAAADGQPGAATPDRPDSVTSQQTPPAQSSTSAPAPDSRTGESFTRTLFR